MERLGYTFPDHMGTYLLYVLTTFCLCMNIETFDSGFKSEQMKNQRVREAYAEKEEGVKELLLKNQLAGDKLNIFIRIFKREQVIELWGKNRGDEKFIHLKDYSICRSSGNLGPKRKQGDGQVPEGFYSIIRFNPNSNFYLSLQINYPNAADKILGDPAEPGGDIFIHGNCVTIGCIPITNEWIRELYVFAVEARNNGQAEIPVHIFPAKMDSNTFAAIKARSGNNKILEEFWDNLKTGYEYFEYSGKLPAINILADGKYHYK